MPVPSSKRLLWLCSELTAGNAFSADDLHRWAQDARSEQDAGAVSEMLEALKEARSALAARDGTAHVLGLVEAAIAKAEGQS